MRKLLFLFTCLLFVGFMGCSSDSDGDDKHCWEFTLTQVTSISGVAVEGYPQTVTTKTTQCDLTEEEAESVVKKLTTTTTSTEAGVKITITTTATKTKK